MFKLIKFIVGFILFLILAAVVFVIVLVVINWSNKPKKRERISEKKISDVTSMTINVDVKDAYVHVKKNKDNSIKDQVKITYYDCKTRTFDMTEEVDGLNNATLTLKGYQTGKWYNRIFFTFNTTKVYGVTIEVPDEVNVNVKTDNGNIRFEDAYLNIATADVYNGAVIFKKSNASICSFNSINGNVEADSSNVGTFYSRTRKGKVKLENLVALLTIDAATDSGKVEVTNSYATGNITLHSGKGDITGTIRLLSDAYYKIITKAVNGKSNLDNSSTGVAELNVTTDNGNINLELKKVLG